MQALDLGFEVDELEQRSDVPVPAWAIPTASLSLPNTLCIGDQVFPGEDFDACDLLSQSFCPFVLELISFWVLLIRPMRQPQHIKSNLLRVEGGVYVEILDCLHFLRKPCQLLLWLGSLMLSTDLLP